MKTNRSPKIAFAAVALVALAFASTASAQYTPVGDDGIAASPKVRQILNERKASTAPAVASAPAMACPKCADVLTTDVNRQAKGAQVLAGTATTKVAKHTCTACETKLTVIGEGKATSTPSRPTNVPPMSRTQRPAAPPINSPADPPSRGASSPPAGQAILAAC